MNINLLPLFASNVFHFNIDEDTSELDPNDFEFLQLGGNNFASSPNAYSTASIRVLEKYPNTKKIILDKFKEIAKNVLGYSDANSTEMDKETNTPVIDLMEEQKKIIQ